MEIKRESKTIDNTALERLINITSVFPIVIFDYTIDFLEKLFISLLLVRELYKIRMSY